jgi:serine/threonine protein kinase
MNLSDPGRTDPFPRAADESSPAWEDPRLLPAVQEYQAELEAGRRPNRKEFLARHPDIAAELEECLDGLDFVHTSAARLPKPADPPATQIDPLLQSPLGDFCILREIGRGGMGVVYEAIQLSLGRRVALKVLPFAAALDGKQLQRFHNEARAAALLHHPNIVPVYAVGCERGVHYFAMQLVEGQTLAVLIDQLRHLTGLVPVVGSDVATLRGGTAALTHFAPPATPADGAAATAKVAAQTTAPQTRRPGRDPGFFRTAARLGCQAAEALQHAHDLGVVHRDIKPGNLLLDARGDLWITDFGLAQLHCDARVTRTGDVIGTLRYMSPEQAGGRTAVLDHRTDVYSLGVTLYELLALAPAFDDANPHDLLRKITGEEPRPPRAFDRTIPVELETIVLKAMTKEPAERYPTARELADDLQRFLHDQPIKARRPSLWERGRKWCRRHRPVTVAALILLVVTAVGSLATALLLAQEQARTAVAHDAEQKQLQEAKEQRARADRQRARAEKLLHQAREAVDAFTQLEEEMADRPQLAELRRRLLETALAYYQSFLDECPEDPATRAELAADRERVSAILGELKALRHYERMLGLADALGEKNAREELRLNADQVKAAKQLDHDLRQKPSPAGTEEKRQRLEQLATTYENALGDLLTGEQSRRLNQIALQRRGLAAFSEPEVVAALRLTRDQQAAIGKLQDEARLFQFGKQWPKGLFGPRGKGGFQRKGAEPPRKIGTSAALVLLTNEQKARWHELTGPRYRPEPFMGPPRGPKGS